MQELLAVSLNVDTFLAEIEKLGYHETCSPTSGERWQNGDVFVQFSAQEPDPALARLGARSAQAALWDAWAGFASTQVTLVERGIRRAAVLACQGRDPRITSPLSRSAIQPETATASLRRR